MRVVFRPFPDSDAFKIRDSGSINQGGAVTGRHGNQGIWILVKKVNNIKIQDHKELSNVMRKYLENPADVHCTLPYLDDFYWTCHYELIKWFPTVPRSQVQFSASSPWALHVPGVPPNPSPPRVIIQQVQQGPNVIHMRNVQIWPNVGIQRSGSGYTTNPALYWDFCRWPNPGSLVYSYQMVTQC